MIPQESNYHLLLAHLLSNNEYCSFYRKRKEAGDFIIIDNGAFEFKKPMNVDKYRKMIIDSGIVPDVIVAPDYPFKRWADTANASFDFVSDIRGDRFFDKIKVMGVPQSEEGDYAGWIECHNRLIYESGVDFIGMSILGVPNAFCKMSGTKDVTFNRMLACAIMMNDEVVDKNVKYHFLGCSDPRELIFMKSLGWVYGNDSSTAIWHGINGIRFDDSRGGLKSGKTEIPVDFEYEISDVYDTTEANILYESAIHSNILHNISWINRLLSDER